MRGGGDGESEIFLLSWNQQPFGKPFGIFGVLWGRALQVPFLAFQRNL